jgi:hypothetical protein
MACGQVSQCTGSLQFGILRLSLFQDADVGVGVFPEREDVVPAALILSYSHNAAKCFHCCFCVAINEMNRTSSLRLSKLASPSKSG